MGLSESEEGVAWLLLFTVAGGNNPRPAWSCSDRPAWADISMFIGEFLCVLPLLWNWLNSPTKGRPTYLSRLLRRTNGGYSPVRGAAEADEDDEVNESDADSDEGDQVPMRGLATFWMWFPAFFDSEWV